MSKQKKANIESSSVNNNNNSTNSNKIKILAIVLAFVSLFLFIALLSYNKQDQANAEISLFDLFGLFTGDDLIILKAETTQNLLGLLGAYISNYFFNHTTGYTSLVFPVILMLWAVNLFRDYEISRETLRKSYLFILISITFATLMGGIISLEYLDIFTQEWAGIVGLFMSSIFTNLIGITGTLLVFAFLLLLELYYTFGLKIDKMFESVLNQSNNLIDFSKEKITQIKENAAQNQADSEEFNDNNEFDNIENHEENLQNIVDNTSENNIEEEIINPVITNATEGYPNTQFTEPQNQITVKLGTDNSNQSKFVTHSVNDANKNLSVNFANPNENKSPLSYIPGVGNRKININLNTPAIANNSGFNSNNFNPNNNQTNNNQNQVSNNQTYNNQTNSNQIAENNNYQTPNNNDFNNQNLINNPNVDIFDESEVDIREIIKQQKFDNVNNLNEVSTINTINSTDSTIKESHNSLTSNNEEFNKVESIAKEELAIDNFVTKNVINVEVDNQETIQNNIKLDNFDLNKELETLGNSFGYDTDNHNESNISQVSTSYVEPINSNLSPLKNELKNETDDVLEQLYNQIKQPNTSPLVGSSNSSIISSQNLSIETALTKAISQSGHLDKTITVNIANNESLSEEKPLKYVLSTGIHDEEIDYTAPKLSYLLPDFKQNTVNEAELEMNARILQEKLETFKITIENLTVTPGPVVTQYEFIPSDGIKISKIQGLENDMAMALKAKGIRIIAPVPGRGTVGIEIPNNERQMIRFTALVQSQEFQNTNCYLPLALGKDVSGKVVIADLAKMPHLLIAGTTGSGKSVGINTIILSLIYKKHPSELKFIIVDPKKVELQQYSGLSQHFMASSPDIRDTIITNSSDAVMILKSAVLEMEQRYDLLASVGQRNLFDYNVKVEKGELKQKGDIVYKKLPFIVVIIDELADLMLTASKEIEEPIVRLAQMARAVGIHLILATQRPSVKVITGLIKANFPARIAYTVKSNMDSRVILDYSGAERLLGYGDMLFMSTEFKEPLRIQNSFLTTEEVETVCEHIAEQVGYSQPYMLPSTYQNNDLEASDFDFANRDELFEDAARFFIQQGTASTSILQRKFRIGYARAGKLVDELEAAGVIGPANGSKPRLVLFDSASDLERIL